jgi:hypothetical protein
MASPPPPSGPSPGAGPSRAPREPQDPLQPLNRELESLSLSGAHLSAEEVERSASLERTQETKGDPRAGLEAHAAAQDHPSVEAWLHALTPPQLDREGFVVLLSSLTVLTTAEQSASALFYGFAPRPSGDPPKTSVDLNKFHPSLLGKMSLIARDPPHTLLPLWSESLLESASR